MKGFSSQQRSAGYCEVSFIDALSLFFFAAFNIGKYFSPPEEEGQEAEKPKLKRGTMYLVKGKNVERSYILFADVVNEETEGLLITRRVPPHVKAADRLPTVQALWLSQKEEENVVYPTQLHKLVYLISETVSNREDPVILLDGLEYLVVHNKFEQVLKQLYIIREVLSRHGGILLIPVDPEAFSEKELGFLEKESVPI
jgi:hypothetical protein